MNVLTCTFGGGETWALATCRDCRFTTTPPTITPTRRIESTALTITIKLVGVPSSLDVAALDTCAGVGAAGVGAASETVGGSGVVIDVEVVWSAESPVDGDALGAPVGDAVTAVGANDDGGMEAVDATPSHVRIPIDK